MGLEGKWALITGAGRKGRVGAAIAKRMASEGANIYLHHRAGGEDEASEVATSVKEAGAKFSVQVVLISAELSDDVDMARAFNNITPDIVVNNAAVFEPARVPEGATLAENLKARSEAFDKNVSANMKGTHLATEAAIHKLVAEGKGGTIVFIGDAYIENGGVYDESLAAYTMSKSAAKQMARMYAAAYGHLDIKFFAVLNGPIEPPPSAPDETVEEIAKEIPLPEDEKNPWIGADAVASAIVYGIAMGMNGGSILVDGGRAWTVAKEH